MFSVKISPPKKVGYSLSRVCFIEWFIGCFPCRKSTPVCLKLPDLKRDCWYWAKHASPGIFATTLACTSLQASLLVRQVQGTVFPSSADWEGYEIQHRSEYRLPLLPAFLSVLPGVRHLLNVALSASLVFRGWEGERGRARASLFRDVPEQRLLLWSREVVARAKYSLPSARQSRPGLGRERGGQNWALHLVHNCVSCTSLGKVFFRGRDLAAKRCFAAFVNTCVIHM